VTPPPTDYHETIAARLTRLLDPFVAANGLGLVYHPRAVMRFEGSEVEPDLMVREAHPRPEKDWNKAPRPSLIVEILSEYTRRRDKAQKKNLYLEAGLEYWIVDPEARTITVARPGESDRVEREAMSWTPVGVSATLILGFADIFG
jgi:Uma2 family endonuclease